MRPMAVEYIIWEFYTINRLPICPRFKVVMVSQPSRPPLGNI
jgi:hypothetical protein